jgi:hypothetical protein
MKSIVLSTLGILAITTAKAGPAIDQACEGKEMIPVFSHSFDGDSKVFTVELECASQELNAGVIDYTTTGELEKADTVQIAYNSELEVVEISASKKDTVTGIETVGTYSLTLDTVDTDSGKKISVENPHYTGGVKEGKLVTNYTDGMPVEKDLSEDVGVMFDVAQLLYPAGTELVSGGVVLENAYSLQADYQAVFTELAEMTTPAEEQAE